MTGDTPRHLFESTGKTEQLPPGALTAGELGATTDATVWATQFALYSCPLRKELILDQGFLLGWFANAIEAGVSAGTRRTCPHPYAALYRHEGVAICGTCGHGLPKWDQ